MTFNASPGNLLQQTGRLLRHSHAAWGAGLLLASCIEVWRLMITLGVSYIYGYIYLFFLGFSYAVLLSNAAVDASLREYNLAAPRALLRQTSQGFNRLYRTQYWLVGLPLLLLFLLWFIIDLAVNPVLPDSLEPWLVVVADPASYLRVLSVPASALLAPLFLALVALLGQIALFDPQNPAQPGLLLRPLRWALRTGWQFIRAYPLMLAAILGIILLLTLVSQLILTGVTNLIGLTPLAVAPGYWNSLHPAGVALVLANSVVAALVNTPFAAFGLALWALFYQTRRLPAAQEQTITPDNTAARVAPLGWFIGAGLLTLLAVILGGAGLAAAARQTDPSAAWYGRLLLRQSGIINGLALSADNRRLATCSESGFGGHADNVRLWDISQPDQPAQPRGIWPTIGGCQAVAFSADNQLLAVGDENGHISLINMADTAAGLHSIFITARNVNSLAFSPDNSLLAIVSSYSVPILLDLQHNYTPLRLTGSVESSPQLAFSPDGSRLAAASYGLNIWSLTTAISPTLVTVPSAVIIGGLAFAPDGAVLATGSIGPQQPDDKSTAANQEQKGLFVQLRDGHSGAALPGSYALADNMDYGSIALAYSPDAQWIAAAGDHLYILDARRSGAFAQLPNSSNSLQAVVFGNDSRTLYSAARFGGDVRVWTAPANQP